jgi:endoglucanase
VESLIEKRLAKSGCGAHKTRFGNRPNRIRKRILGVLCCFIFVALSGFTMKAITLKWNANTEANLAGYTVYSGTNSHSYNKSNFVGNVTTNTPTGLIAGTTYYFAMTAKNTSGQESDFSNEISVKVPTVLGQPVQASTQLAAGKIKLTWGSSVSSLYRVYYKTNLAEPAWNPLTADLLAVGPTTSWTDPTLPKSGSRFYRVFQTQ